MVLEWTLSKRLGLAYSKINLSLLQRQSASQEKHESMGDSTFSSISLLGILGPGDRSLCMRLPLHVHYQPKRASETQNHHLMDQGTGDLRSECVKLVLVSFTLIYTHCQQYCHLT